jgi:hypothetical protein
LKAQHVFACISLTRFCILFISCLSRVRIVRLFVQRLVDCGHFESAAHIAAKSQLQFSDDLELLYLRALALSRVNAKAQAVSRVRTLLVAVARWSLTTPDSALAPERRSLKGRILSLVGFLKLTALFGVGGAADTPVTAAAAAVAAEAATFYQAAYAVSARLEYAAATALSYHMAGKHSKSQRWAHLVINVAQHPDYMRRVKQQGQYATYAWIAEAYLVLRIPKTAWQYYRRALRAANKVTDSVHFIADVTMHIRLFRRAPERARKRRDKSSMGVGEFAASSNPWLSEKGMSFKHQLSTPRDVFGAASVGAQTPAAVLLSAAAKNDAAAAPVVKPQRVFTYAQTLEDLQSLFNKCKVVLFCGHPIDPPNAAKKRRAVFPASPSLEAAVAKAIAKELSR